MHLGMPECHKPFLGHCDLDLWPSFQELLCPEHISYIIWCRNPKFGVVIPLGMAEWCIQFWVILTLTLTSGFISRFFLLYYSYLSSNVSCARPIPLGAFVTCLWHFLFPSKMLRGCLVCVNCNSSSIHSFIFQICIMIVQTLKMCTIYFVHISQILFFIFRGLELRHFYCSKCLDGV